MKEGVYERLVVLEEIVEKAQRILYELWPGAGGLIFHHFEVQFYKDDDKKSVGVTLQFDDEFDITPNVLFFEKVREATGASDIFLKVENGIVTEIELYFEEAVADE